MDESKEDEIETVQDKTFKGSTKLISNRGIYKLCDLGKELKKKYGRPFAKKKKIKKNNARI